jgi:phosphoglycolate phosphatase
LTFDWDCCAGLLRFVTARALPNLEILTDESIASRVTHVIFDFDGTLSWLRSGWPDVMAGLFAEYIPGTASKSPEVRQQLRREILALNGKPSIYQMRRFEQLASRFQANPPDPESLLQLYLSRLDTVLCNRAESVMRSEILATSFVIAGAEPLLEELRRRGLKLFILSGTAEPDVRREAELLNLKPFFGEEIHGSTPGREFSKKDVIDRIIRDEGIDGSRLLSFGDGPVEIEFTKAVGGRAVGVASDEEVNGSGVIDPDKREHLLRAGADAIIPDYRNLRWILDNFFA